MPRTAAWHPTTFLRFEEALNTSMGTARIVTDAGRAYIKALGNRQGPHPLACEWVATHLADWFGLPTLDFDLMMVDADTDEIPFLHGEANAASGTAFVTRATAGHTWGGSADELAQLTNPSAITRLVVFDTWTLNNDRHPPDPATRRPNYDNVFLVDGAGDEVGRSRLIAMDHSHCLTGGGTIDRKIANIAHVKDDRLYGLFPAFVASIRQDEVEWCVSRLKQLEKSFVEKIVASIPDDWEVATEGKKSLVELICRRADFVQKRFSLPFHAPVGPIGCSKRSVGEAI